MNGPMGLNWTVLILAAQRTGCPGHPRRPFEVILRVSAIFHHKPGIYNDDVAVFSSIELFH